MRSVEYTNDLTLPDERVAICGDWHGNLGWLRALTRALPVLAPDVTTVLQLGDWWMDPAETDSLFRDAGIGRVYVTLGNHEPWGEISPLFAAHPGAAVRVSEITWLLPRPARLTIGGRTALSLGGAASVDRAARTEGHNWWPDEAITDDHVAAAIAGGPADLMLTHESPARTPVRKVREMLRTNPLRFTADARAASTASRARVSEVWDAVRPELLIHAHMHIPGGGATADGRRVASMGRDVQEGNLALLDMHSLTFEAPTLRHIREAVDHRTRPLSWQRPVPPPQTRGGSMSDQDGDTNPWARIVGPCYTVASMARTLGWTEDEVMEAGNTLRLLMLHTTDDVYLFPTFQLHDGKVVEGLTEVLRVLQTGTADSWTWAQWLNVELPDEDPPRNITLLYEGRLDEAIRDAKHDAWSWTS